MATAAVIPESAAQEDAQRFFWYGVWALIMALTATPLFGFRVKPVLSYTPLLVIHEFAAFLYFGHTFFSNVWAMRIRLSQPLETGVWARGFLRKLALGITAPTSIITPLAGLMVVENWGGLLNAPWAWDAYFAFWIMAGVSIIPDVIRYARNRHSGDPRHGVASGATRGMIALVLTLYIMLCMIAKVSLIAPLVLRGASP